MHAHHKATISIGSIDTVIPRIAWKARELEPTIAIPILYNMTNFCALTIFHKQDLWIEHNAEARNRAFEWTIKRETKWLTVEGSRRCHGEFAPAAAAHAT